MIIGKNKFILSLNARHEEWRVHRSFPRRDPGMASHDFDDKEQ